MTFVSSDETLCWGGEDLWTERASDDSDMYQSHMGTTPSWGAYKAYDDENWQTSTSSTSSDIYSPQHLITPSYNVNHQAVPTWADTIRMSPNASFSSPVSQSGHREGEGTRILFRPAAGETSSSRIAKTSRPSRKPISYSTLLRRRSQNRESQRTYREKQKIQMQWLEDENHELRLKCSQLECDYEELDGKYRALVERSMSMDDGQADLWIDGDDQTSCKRSVRASNVQKPALFDETKF